jgi:16S rRNA (uracil1498-N3)-methyltransferase
LMPERPTLDHLFIRPEDSSKERFELTGEEYFHLCRVKRARRGEEVSWSDGAGRTGRAVIENIATGSLQLRITDNRPTDIRRPSLHLFQSLPKSGKMDDIVRRNVEVGVDAFFPIVSSRSQIRPGRDGYADRLERWRKIAREASRQCRRDFLPEVHEVMRWQDCLDLARGYTVTVVAWEEERRQRVAETLPGKTPQTVAMFVGPEGGFGSEEVTELEETGALPVSLGDNILRTENAGLVLAVLIKAHYGHL